MVTLLAHRNLLDRVPTRTAARLRAFRRDAERALPGRVADVVLFGSRARGDAHPGSDYDLAVFVRGLNDRRAVDHALSDVAYPYILAGVHIRPVAVPAGYLESRGGDPLAAQIARYGIAVR